MHPTASTSIPDWFLERYGPQMSVTAASLQDQQANLLLVHQSNDPDLPTDIFADLSRLAVEMGRTVEGMFLFQAAGRKPAKKAGKYTVNPNGDVLQNSWISNLVMPVSRQFFSGDNTRISLKNIT